MQDTAPRRATPDVRDLPRRIAFEDPAKTGIILNHTPTHAALAQRWAYRTANSGDATNCSVATAAVALVDNAHRHSRSGLPGGSVQLVLTRGAFLLELTVTDNGPRPGTVRYPLPRLRPDTTGLRLVERVAVYWDGAGAAGGPLTVRAMFELP